MAESCSTFSVSGVFLPISRTQLNLKSSKSLSFNSKLNLSPQFLIPKLQIKVPRNHNSRLPIIFAVQSNFFRAIQTALKVGKDGVEAGTNLVPAAIPRPIARVAVTAVAITLSLFVVRSFISTVFFALGVMGFVYFIYLALNKDSGSKNDGNPSQGSSSTSTSTSTSTDDAIEEAKRIMDKYK